MVFSTYLSNRNQIRSFLASLVATAILLSPLQAAAATTFASDVANPAPAAKITFTFDDGLASTYPQAYPTLSKYGLTGTDYVITGCVGMTTTPNTCRANDSTPYMS